ncbi:MAG: hypothetical protein K2G44_00860 [Clostridia bacterium]|nr:hypothetical protein [Clostridia bacterium]
MREQITKTRLTRMLAEDKEGLNPETAQAALLDFQRVANEYFETESKPKMLTQKENGLISVTVTFRAVRVKNFTKLK